MGNDLVERLCATRALEITNRNDVQAYVTENYTIRHEAAARIEALERELGEAREAAIEECAVAAEAWEPVEYLLPLCNESDNEAAMTGQWEARERIAAAIRDLRPAARAHANKGEPT